MVKRTSKIVKQEAEIADCQWLDPEVYFKQEFFMRSGVYNKINGFVRSAVTNGSFPALSELETMVEDDLRDDKEGEGEGDSAGSLVSLPPNVTAMITEKLPIGFRPGTNSLYYIHSSSSSTSIAAVEAESNSGKV